MVVYHMFPVTIRPLPITTTTPVSHVPCYYGRGTTSQQGHMYHRCSLLLVIPLPLSPPTITPVSHVPCYYHYPYHYDITVSQGPCDTCITCSLLLSLHLPLSPPGTPVSHVPCYYGTPTTIVPPPHLYHMFPVTITTPTTITTREHVTPVSHVPCYYHYP